MANTLIFIKRFLTAFFVNIIFKPLKIIGVFIFKKAIVKGYCIYLSSINKLGWKKTEGSIIGFMINQKLVHILVVLLTITIVFSNFISSTKASVSERVRDTMLADLVQSEFGSVEENYLIEEFYDENLTLKPSIQKYIEDNISAVTNQSQVVIDSLEEISESDKIGSYTQGGSAIAKQDIASTKKSIKPRKETVVYKVESGDTISTIAAKFDISVNTILWENNLSAHSLIRPGQELSILPVSGVAHTISKGENLSYLASKYDVEEDEILSFNKLANANQLVIGEKLIIPGGAKSSYASRSSDSYSGVSAIRNIVKPAAASPLAGNKMNWPTQGSRITQYYSWRHHGVDIANKTGTPIYAADAGTVEYIGWGTGYGNNIIVNHGGGKKTRYAHLSQFYVKRGQVVGKGESIGAMGSTGWSTGPHLHFEVIINGAKYNPLNYIK